MGVLCLSLFWYALLWFLSSYAIILARKIGFVALFFSFGCFVTANVLWRFLTVPWVGLQCLIVIFSDHTHLLFSPMLIASENSLVLDQGRQKLNPYLDSNRLTP